MTEHATAGQPAPAGRPAPVLDSARGRLTRYRVMAWITGTMLLVLCVEMVLKYVFQLNGRDPETGDLNPVIGMWVAIVHGWIYVVYLVTVVQLWSAMRWSLGRLATMALAGVVPVMSFVLERRVHADALTRIESRPAAEG
jgi:integral membrane protein